MPEISWTPKSIRVRYGKTQDEVAEYLGLSLATYKRKENERAKWYVDEYARLAKFYGVDVSIFFNSEVS